MSPKRDWEYFIKTGNVFLLYHLLFHFSHLIILQDIMLPWACVTLPAVMLISCPWLNFLLLHCMHTFWCSRPCEPIGTHSVHGAVHYLLSHCLLSSQFTLCAQCSQISCHQLKRMSCCQRWRKQSPKTPFAIHISMQCRSVSSLSLYLCDGRLTRTPPD